MGQCITPHVAALQLRLRTRVIVRNRLTNLEAGGGSAPGNTRTDSTDSVARAAAAAGGAADGGGSSGRPDAAAQLQTLRSDSAVQKAAQLQQRMHRVIAAVGFRPEQRTAFVQVETLPLPTACSVIPSWHSAALQYQRLGQTADHVPLGTALAVRLAGVAR